MDKINRPNPTALSLDSINAMREEFPYKPFFVSSIEFEGVLFSVNDHKFRRVYTCAAPAAWEKVFPAIQRAGVGNDFNPSCLSIQLIDIDHPSMAKLHSEVFDALDAAVEA